MTLEELQDAEPSEIFQTYIDQKKMWQWEGDSGMEKLNTIAKDLGYKGNGFKYGSNLECLLSDNPGCQEAIVEWIREHLSEEQTENIANEIEVKESDGMEE